MKNFILLYLTCTLFSTFLIYSQPENVNTNFPFTGVNEGLIDSQCIGGLTYDDNTFENGYGWGPNFGIGKWVMLMTPTSYPFTINQVCLALTRYPSATYLNFTFDIVVYDTTGPGGSPGNLLASIPNQIVNNPPPWPQVAWYDFTGLTGIPAITSGSVYVGISFDPQPVENRQKYIGADESATTTQRPGWGYIQGGWSPITTYFSQYKAIGIRCDGTGQTYVHNIRVGPFLSLPGNFNAGTECIIKAKIKNIGTSNEADIPLSFVVNGIQIAAITMNLNAGAVDSVSFNWTPTDTGIKNLRIVSGLVNDEFRNNDTVSANVVVFPPGYYQTCHGTGVTPVSYPFNTFYMDSRTDMLYTASEIGLGPSTIVKIGYTVYSPAPQVMNGFKVKMQNTTASAISSFTSEGWTDVYADTFSITSPGLTWIYLTTPFVYTGGNLLIEICFNNSSYTGSSTVASTSNPGRVFHNYMDLPTGDGCVEITTGIVQTTLPNICFAGPLVGINNEHNKIPKEFSLSQNYPNPFNPKTKINYQLPIDNYVRLTIFDALGREVAVLVNEKQNAGNYSVEWDGTNYSSGLYFYKLECEGFTDVKKLVLIK